MKYKFFIISFTSFIFMLGFVFSSEGSDWKDRQYERLNREFKTYDDHILWHGDACRLDFTLNGLSENQKKELRKNGLVELEESASEGDIFAQYLLACHFFYKKKSYRQALFWSIKGAEGGSSQCMMLLRRAYGSGYGVIIDTEESLKWLFLAAAMGNSEAQQEAKKLESLGIVVLKVCPDAYDEHKKRLEQGRYQAKEWMNSHQDLFFNPN